MTETRRQQIIDAFNAIYRENIELETRRRGRISKGAGIPMERLKELFNDAVVEFHERTLKSLTCLT